MTSQKSTFNEDTDQQVSRENAIDTNRINYQAQNAVYVFARFVKAPHEFRNGLLLNHEAEVLQYPRAPNDACMQMRWQD